MPGFPSVQLVTCSLLAVSAAAGLRPLATAQTFKLSDIRFTPVVGGLSRPVAITHAGDSSGRLFITQQAGRIVIFDGQQVLGQPFLDISDRVGCCGERGLLSVAFHPNYGNAGTFFVNYTDVSGDTVVARYEVTQNPNVADPNSEVVLLNITQPFSNHNGGQLQFGPDGFLYISTGDGGLGGDPGNRAQDLETLLGKILRIDVDRGDPFAVPPGNPFVGQPPAQPEIWAFGLRNPWRFSFDRSTGEMFIGDVGQTSVEEIDFQPTGVGGLNYGWRRMEGSQCFNPTALCNDGTLTLPILEYPNRGRAAVAGGYRYRGLDFPQLNGVYFYADYATGKFFAGVEEDGEWTAIGPNRTAFQVSTFGEDEQGEIYFADYAGGMIYRVTTDFPKPSISSLSPVSAVAGSPGFALTAAGSNFIPASELWWDGESRPTTFLDETRLQASISDMDIALPGTPSIAVFNPAPGGGTTQELLFQVDAPPGISPSINPAGVVNAASFTEPLAPGAIASVFGVDLGVIEESSLIAPLPTMLAGATLIFNGSIPAPQYFGSPTQSNIQIPWELAGTSDASLTVQIGNTVSEAATVPLAEFSPGIFSMDQSGAGQGAVLISGTASLAAPLGFNPNSRPVSRGEFLEIFATGLGAATNTPASGSPASGNPVSESITTPSVTVGGADVNVVFSGLAPNFVGLYQVNVPVPADGQSGPSVPVTLSVGGVESNTVTVAIE